MSWLISLEGIDGSGKTTLIKNLKRKTEFELITHNSTFVYQGLEGNIKIDTIQEIAQKTINLPFPDITFILDIDPQKAQERLNKRKVETGEYTNWDNLKLEFHQRIRNNYLKLKKLFPERIYIIDASKSENEIVEEIEKNETAEEAAKREVFEETNLVLEDYEKINEKNKSATINTLGNFIWKKLEIMDKRPLLISIEGIDGSGKTSLIESLKQKIPNSFATQSPRGTELGKKV
ncbi:5225_t:CDS:2 [Scutellospora calospora]|uniref:5225_t:CDS:1 n=1 Tax=Scutellospora calospora TaxID=85575 RepID=A0ACA9KJU1_9GLOM|nr:5225_t:CDS:2 [Scutellospora calospora]